MKDTILHHLSNIAEELHQNNNVELNSGVLAGLSGEALFYFYYAKLINSEEHAQIASSLIDKAIDVINDGNIFPTYCTGIAGFGWTLQHLHHHDFIDIELDELLSSFDEFLYGVMQENFTSGEFDFLHGALGYAFYFLKRYEYTVDDELKKTYQQYIQVAIDHLQRLAIKDEHGLKWKSVVKHDEEFSCYNFGLSHGIASIVNFLARAHSHEAFKASTLPLLIGGTSYLLSTQINDSSKNSLFACWQEIGKDEILESRLAWCYGDLGIAISIWYAGKVLENDFFKQEAIRIFHFNAKRRDMHLNFINDAGLCHGTAGIWAIFNRIYKETKEQVFKETADHWLDVTLSFSKMNDGGIGGYKKWRGDIKIWETESNLLEGAAGIGLVLVSALDEFDSHWEECLLIS